MGKEGLLACHTESDRFDNLIGENAVLARELAAAQRRCTRQAIAHANRVDPSDAKSCGCAPS